MGDTKIDMIQILSYQADKTPYTQIKRTKIDGNEEGVNKMNEVCAISAKKKKHDLIF